MEEVLYDGYDFKHDEAFYERFHGRTIELIKQKDSHRIYIKFTDGTAMNVFNKGIHNENEHLHIYDMGNINKLEEDTTDMSLGEFLEILIPERYLKLYHLGELVYEGLNDENVPKQYLSKKTTNKSGKNSNNPEYVGVVYK